MSVYMGEDGSLSIERTAVGEGFLSSDLDPDDVNPARRRFSFDFPAGALITGDKIEIGTADKSILYLVKDHVYPDGAWYCNIDDVGGVRLYNNFDDAINGNFETALELVTPPETKEILVRTRDTRFRCYGQMRNWEITTSREAVDTTTLGEDFVSQYSRGLISGQGSVECIWDFRQALCDPLDPCTGNEEPHYLCQLLLRLKQGAMFRGRFFLYTGEPSVWYEADCVVTNAGLGFAPGQVVQSKVDFVTTGSIELHTGQPDGFILKEDDGLLLQEDDDGLLLEEPL